MIKGSEGKRLTWKEIIREYPDMWVALTEVKYENNDRCNVEDAVVVCGLVDDECIDYRIEHDDFDYRYERTAVGRDAVGCLV